MALYRLAYARVSSDGQSTEEQGLEQQIANLERFGYDELFQEIISGRRKDRPQFEALVKRALSLREQGHEVKVTFVDVSRWGRDYRVNLGAIERLESAGVTIYEIAGGAVSIKSAGEWLTVSQKSIFAEYYSRDLSDRIKRGVQHKRIVHKPICTRSPWGYRYNSDRTALEPDLSPWGNHNLSVWQVARLVVERVLNGASRRETAYWLWETYGKKFTVSGLGLWLLNPHLRGHIFYYEDPGNPKSKRVLHYDAHPPLLSELEYQQIQAQFELSSSMRGANKGKRIYAVTTLVYCGHCGNRMSPTIAKGSFRYFICGNISCESRQRWGRNRIRDTAIEAAIQEALLERAEGIANQVQQPGQTENPLAVAKREELRQLEELYQSTGREGLMALIEDVRAELRVLENPRGVSLPDRNEWVEPLRDPEFWTLYSNPADLRTLYRALVQRVVVQQKAVASVVLLL